MINLRPRQSKPVPWPWKNKIDDRGFPVVVEHADHVMMPDLVGCFDWADFETQETEFLGDLDGFASRDLKSVYTTAVRMLGIERLYTELVGGNNVFMLIASEMLRWQKFFHRIEPDLRLIIGDDIAHTGGLFFPPQMLKTYLFPAWGLLSSIRNKGLIFHSDGDISAVLGQIIERLDPVAIIVQARLNEQMAGACAAAEQRGVKVVSQPAAMYKTSYPAKEEAQ